MGDDGKSKMRVLDIVYRALGLGIPKTRWVLADDDGGGVASWRSMDARSARSQELSASVTVRRFGRCQCHGSHSIYYPSSRSLLS